MGRNDPQNLGRYVPSLGPATRVSPNAPANPPTAPPRKPPLFQRLPPRWRFFILMPLLAGGLAVLAVAGLMIYFTLLIPNPMALRKSAPAPIIRIVGADGALIAERGQAYDYMPFDLLPPHIGAAVVAIEDRRFYDHWGLDPIGLVRAAFANLRARRFAQGGSTLTQQLAKNLFLSSERKLSRKFEELILALFLEMRLSKRDILELYLNRVYFGGGAYGIEAAAHRYFNKSARDLDLAEAAVIAGVLKAPSKFSPSSSPVLARARARVVLAKMVTANLLSVDAERDALRRPIKFADAPAVRDATGLEYAVEYVLERLPRLLGAPHAQIIIETTIDNRLQRAAQEIVLRHLTFEGDDAQAGQAGLVVLDTDGGMRALIGGRSYADSQFNRAVKAKRQPGSAFKTFVYLSALESGLTPESIVYDLPVMMKGWSPRNEGGTYRGAVTLRQGLAQSINTVAVRLHLDVGTRKTIAVAKRLGITSELRDGPSLALGTSEVSLLELTGAYGAFASGGVVVEPHIIRRVTTGSGRILYAREAPAQRRVIAADHVGAMNDILNAALVYGTGKRAGFPLHPAAGKTGTSQDFRDAWFIGYTAHLVGGVWLGNDNGRAMNKVMGGTLPARIWHEVMLIAHEGRIPLPLPGTATPPPPKPKAAEAPMAPRERIDDNFFEKALADGGRQRDDALAPGSAWRWGGSPPPASRPADIDARKPTSAPAENARATWFGFNPARIRETLGLAGSAPRAAPNSERMGLGR